VTGTFRASVRRALDPDQRDLIEHPEHCSADPERLATAGAMRGSQIRLVRGGADVALFTVAQVRRENPDTVVRMGERGRLRLGTRAEFDGVVDTRVTRSELGDEQAREAGEFVERLRDDGRQAGLVVLAPHGGDIEPHTDEQAEHVAELLQVSGWLCRGFRPRASRRWHITSDDIDPDAFPALQGIFGRGFAEAVSFHGFRPDGGGPDEVVVGGGASARLKRRVARAIGCVVAGSAVTVRIAGAGDPLGGADPRNIVNRICRRGGVQIEQTPVVRELFGLQIAGAVAGVYRCRLRRNVRVRLRAARRAGSSTPFRS
jgi:phage replication-related protein YjqB (UPF0714/DUF867 family)